ncbi:RAxF-45 family protein [Bacillus sp. CGMCC 1.16607]|uniref:RAxF-45 family protein n=1 Tax=Bacillus sp. CGMCC 1.16607 TaxID=3351842 RepID=UPI00362A4D56
MKRRWGEMVRSILFRAQWLDVLYFCRAIFHDEALKGGSMPFFRNFIQKIER